MQEVEALEFYERVTDDEQSFGDKPTRILEHESGATLEVTLVSVDRADLMDEMQRLPESMIEAMSGADDPDEAEERAREQGLLTDVDGETIRAFENIVVQGIEHEELTTKHFKRMVEKFDLEVLFPIGAEIMEESFEDTGSVTDFHEPGSDNNS
jgi:hypothetical protein